MIRTFIFKNLFSVTQIENFGLILLPQKHSRIFSKIVLIHVLRKFQNIVKKKLNYFQFVRKDKLLKKKKG